MSIEKEAYRGIVHYVEQMFPKGAIDHTPEEIISTCREVVMKGLSDEETLSILKKNRHSIPEFGEGLLKEPAILLETIKIIALMETADNWKEFEDLNKKRQEKKEKEKKAPEETGFDKLLKGIMTVPKPKGAKEK